MLKGKFEFARPALDSDVVREPLARFLTRVIGTWERITKGLTPVKTGNLRRSIQTDISHVRDHPVAHAAIGTRTIYAAWIETGERRGKNGKVYMSQPPGGYRMFEQGRTATEKQMDTLKTALGREIAAAWRKGGA